MIDEYKEIIVNMIAKINDLRALKAIYWLVEKHYINK